MRIQSLSRFVPFLSVLAVACSSGGGGATAPGTVPELGVSGFTPASGEVGAVVTVQGKGFGSDPFALTVRFGDAHGAPAAVQLATDDQILVTVPPGARSGPIAVLSPSGSFSSASIFRVLPTVTTLNPPGLPGAPVGTTVEVLGYGFDSEELSNNLVSFSGVPAPILDATPSSLFVSIPVGARTGPLLIATQDGVVELLYTVQPSITGYSPGFGLAGDLIVMSGFNFQSTPSDNQVFFPGIATPVTPETASYSTMEVRIPAGFATTGSIAVATVDGTAVGPFFYFPTTPSISGFSPISGLVGESVNIQGSGFLPNATTVKFNGVPATITGETTTSIDARVPAGASTGFIEVSHAFGSDMSVDPFTLLQAPSITGFSPGLGAWGSPVAISGTNFDPDPAGNTVRFNGVIAPVSLANPTRIVAAVPANSSEGLVTVETAAGLATSATPFNVVFSRYAIVANQIENTISSYEIDGSLGQLRFQSFLNAGSGSGPASVAVNTTGTFAYVTQYDLDLLGVYSIGLDGRLTLLQTIATGDHPVFVGVHPSNNFVYVSNKNTPCVNGTISAYSVGAGGMLTFRGAGTLGAETSAIAFHPNGQFLYATASQSLATTCPSPPTPVLGNSVRTFNIDPSTGALTGSFRTGIADGPTALYMHPSGDWLYVACYENDRVHAFQALGDGRLTLQQSIAAGDRPVALAADPLARVLYAVNQDSNDISGFAIASDGSLASLGGNVPAGTAPSAMMVDFAGKAYVTNRGSGTVSIFSLDSSGVPSLVRNLAAHRGPASIARVDGAGPVRAIPRFAYAADTAVAPSGGAGSGVENSIVPLAIGAGGSPSSNGIPVAAGLTPMSLAADPTGSFLYAGNNSAQAVGAASISMYRIQSDGTLLVNGSVDVGPGGVLGQPTWLGIEPSGNFLFLKAYASPGAISVFQIDRSPGNLGKLNAVGAPFVITGDDTSEGQFGAVLHPNGRFLYAEVLSFFGDASIVSCSVDLATGAVAPIGSVATAGNADLMTIHPNGIGLYTANLASVNSVSFYPIGANGAAQATTQSQPTGNDPRGIAITPNGRFLFTANKTGDSVSSFPVNDDGTLQPRIDADAATAGTQDFAAGDEPFAVAVDRSGRFLVVTNAILTSGPTGLTRVFEIQSDGRLVLVGTPVMVGERPQAVTTVSTFQ